MLIETMEVMKLRQDQWDSKAAVRKKPRRILENSDVNDYFFPLNRQPIAIHPLVTDLGDKAIHYILLQTSYRYMYEIAILELEVVNNVALKIATNQSVMLFSDVIRSDAMSVIIDEAYHAYVAFDFIKQAEGMTKIKSLSLPIESAVSRALSCYFIDKCSKDFTLLELVSVCLSEHVLTKDLVNLRDESNVSKFFIEVMQDHLIDEGRHASFFANILHLIWKNITQENRRVIADYLPFFIDSYISKQAVIEHNKLILTALGFTPKKIDEIIHDTYFEQDKNSEIDVINFKYVLEKAGLLEDNEVQYALLRNDYTLL